jgi:hypothetical protein
LFLYPEIVGEAEGAVDITYYAGAGTGDTSGSYRHARAENGKDFAASTVVSAPLMFSAARAAPTWLGDYVGLTWQGGSVYTAFGDNASGTAHIAFYRDGTQ